MQQRHRWAADYCARYPPSTGKPTPVTQAASSDARNTAPFATSATLPHSPHGVVLIMEAFTSGSVKFPRVMEVFVTQDGLGGEDYNPGIATYIQDTMRCSGFCRTRNQQQFVSSYSTLRLCSRSMQLDKCIVSRGTSVQNEPLVHTHQRRR